MDPELWKTIARRPGFVPRGDVVSHLTRWRHSRMTAMSVVCTLIAATGIVLIAGGPPTAWTHLYYFVILPVAVLWGRWWGLALGAFSGVLAGPVAEAMLGRLSLGDTNWIVRCLAMMLVGWATGSLATSLLQRLAELQDINQEMIEAFVRAVDARDPNTARHSERVSELSAALAGALGMDEPAVEQVRLAAMLHDVGKLSLERSVLQKPGLLSPEEWLQVREHPVVSVRVISGVRRFMRFCPGVRHHHERYDGTGYPDGLMGDEIPLDARIIAVCDSYEAMTAGRAYQHARTHEQAIGEIRASSGTQFDPRCVTAFCDLPELTEPTEGPDPAMLQVDRKLP